MIALGPAQPWEGLGRGRGSGTVSVKALGSNREQGSRVESSWHGETEGQSPFAASGVWDANWGNNMRLPALVFPLGWRENGWETKNEYRSNQGCKARDT